MQLIILILFFFYFAKRADVFFNTFLTCIRNCCIQATKCYHISKQMAMSKQNSLQGKALIELYQIINC